MANEDVFQLGIKAAITNSDGAILLLKVNLEELSGYQGEAYWDIPGGRIKRNQSTSETLQREVLEETGLTVTDAGKLLGSTISNIRIPNNSGGDFGLVLFVYQCSVSNEQEVQLSSEHVDLWWASPEEASRALSVKYPAEFAAMISDAGK